MQALISCISETSTSYHTICGHVALKSDSLITVTNEHQSLTFSRSKSTADLNYIFTDDSVVVRYSVEEDIKVSDVILVTHSSKLTNVAELFVGSWNEVDTSETITFNSDLTTSTKDRWAIDGHKIVIAGTDSTMEYDIVSVDNDQMVLGWKARRLCYRRIDR